jgi:GrpB-like predicted nucleotidyltransferase (UPF0157 family)
MSREIEIVSYRDAEGIPTVGFRKWDARFPAVAGEVMNRLRSVLPGMIVEHVGSTAIPGCDGKGIIDLMVVVPEGRMSGACASVDQLGFQLQSGGWIHPEERPMREGALFYEGELFRLHLHLVPDNFPDVKLLRKFRETLLADPALVDRYVELKRELCSATSDRAEYTRSKNAFIAAVLSEPKP